MSIDWSTAPWRKSSGSDGGGCVEVAVVKHQVGVRDTKDRSGPMLEFDESAWRSFVGDVKAARFDLADAVR